MKIKILNKLFCKHEYQFERNVYGDEINWCNCRSYYRCVKCGKTKRGQYLNYRGEI